MDMYIKTAPNETAIDNWLKNVNLIKKCQPHVPMDMSVKMAQKQNWYINSCTGTKNGNHLNGMPMATTYFSLASSREFHIFDDGHRVLFRVATPRREVAKQNRKENQTMRNT